MSEKSVIIFGGGLSGLVAANICSQSGIKSLLVENTNLLGGGNKSLKDKEGNIFDYGYHALDYNRSLVTTKFFKKVLKNNYRKFKLRRGIILKDRLIPYNEKINNWPKELKILFPKKLKNGGKEEDFFGLIYPWFFPRTKKINQRKSEWDVFHDKMRNDLNHFVLYPKKGGFGSFVESIYDNINQKYCKIIKNAKNIEFNIQPKTKKISSVKINGKVCVADTYFWCNSPISLCKILDIKIKEKIGRPQQIVFGNFVLKNKIKSRFHEILVGSNQHKINRISFPGKIANNNNKLIQVEYSFPLTATKYDKTALKKSWINSLKILGIIRKQDQIKKFTFMKEIRGFVTKHNSEELRNFYRKMMHNKMGDNIIIPSFNLGPENINRVVPDVILNTTNALI